MGVAEELRGVRENPRRHLIALGAAALLGIALSTVHWIGLVIGGIGVGVASTSVRRALLGGVTFGLIAWALLVLSFLLDGSFGTYLAFGPIAGLAVAIPVALGLLGSLARVAV